MSCTHLVNNKLSIQSVNDIVHCTTGHASVITELWLTMAWRDDTENVPTRPRASLVGFEIDPRRDCIIMCIYIVERNARRL